jgi:hypothetical protein
VPQAKQKSKPTAEQRAEQRAWSGTPEPKQVDVSELLTSANEDQVDPDEFAADQILDLDDVAPIRPRVRRHGEQYEVKTLGEFGIRKQQQLNRDGREFAQLWSSEDELDESQLERLDMLLQRMFEEVFVAPDDVRAQMNDAERSRVVLHFRLAPLQQVAAALAKATEDEPRDQPSTTAS